MFDTRAVDPTTPYTIVTDFTGRYMDTKKDFTEMMSKMIRF